MIRQAAELYSGLNAIWVMPFPQVNRVGVGVAIGIGVEWDLFDSDPDTDADPEVVGFRRFTINLSDDHNHIYANIGRRRTAHQGGNI